MFQALTVEMLWRLTMYLFYFIYSFIENKLKNKLKSHSISIVGAGNISFIAMASEGISDRNGLHARELQVERTVRLVHNKNCRC